MDFCPGYCLVDCLNRNDNIHQIIVDYIYWSMYAYRRRSPAGKVFRVLKTFRKDSEMVFGENFRHIVENFKTLGVENTAQAVKCFTVGKNALREAVAMVDLCASLADYWGGEDLPTDDSLQALRLMTMILSDVDYPFIELCLKVRLNKLKDNE
ncbi:6L [Yaba monkey tumor virus]|uniref:6L n=1 Tax=Yaba monkey tumor virus (strain VR587) TaxID=928314 RepID=Q6TV01_YMTV5|nr:hypothetical protein YMTVg6L [Yaba monkey tumor virus]AAR07368.1 6L [Yaba monkey tumor virus]